MRRAIGEGLTIQDRKARATYCVFNKTRESFVSLHVTAADTHLSRLMGLMGRFRLKSDEGLWVIPSQGIHTIGVLFAIDLIYLDTASRVVNVTESLGSFRLGPLRFKCASVLELPVRTIYSSHTQVGDQLLICPQKEMETYLSREQTENGFHPEPA
jgi:uncharacterized membrane protein (UPF0127 family)